MGSLDMSSSLGIKMLITYQIGEAPGTVVRAPSGGWRASLLKSIKVSIWYGYIFDFKVLRAESDFLNFKF